MSDSNQTLIVCGGGLAGHIAAVSLANGLGEGRKIVFLPDVASNAADPLYGSVTAPGGYEFLRGLGLDEPTLIQQTSTSFSFGTAFRDWPFSERDWVQCHHLPFPALAGVPFQQHVTRHEKVLEPLLVSAQAANKGKFAHPPEDNRVSLSRAEYGYQFSVDDFVAFLKAQIESTHVEIVEGGLSDIKIDNGRITEIEMQSGEQVSGNLFVDCTGFDRLAVSALGGHFETEREVAVSIEAERAAKLGPPCRAITGTANGWRATTHLQGFEHHLTVCEPGSASPDSSIEMSLGSLPEAWISNCVAVGHAAHVSEPLTPAPMMLLQADLERLLELIPVNDDMTAERREYNRRFEADVTNAGLFQNALFRGAASRSSPYWTEAAASSASGSLDRKIAQFEHRGLLAKNDLELFTDEDWLILHNGMGRQPAKYDRQVERASKIETEKQLAGLRHSIEQIVDRMPTHHDYVANLKRYLEKQQNG